MVQNQQGSVVFRQRVECGQHVVADLGVVPIGRYNGWWRRCRQEVGFRFSACRLAPAINDLVASDANEPGRRNRFSAPLLLRDCRSVENLRYDIFGVVRTNSASGVCVDRHHVGVVERGE